MSTPRPNFFIVGAPRCGTTALYEYLSRHPDIYMPYHKEPVYFGADLKKRPRVFDEAAYLELFNASHGERRLGEATVWYLYSQTAPAEIKAFCPDARIIIMLRNPVDMAYSLHSHMLFTANEDIADFAEALDAEAARRRGERLPPYVKRPEGLQYRACGRYATHVQRWIDEFGRDAVKIILFDDFSADPAGVFHGVLEFLGVDSSFRPAFDVVNRNKGIRSATLQRMYAAPAFFSITRRLPGPAYHVVKRVLRRLNMRRVERPPLDPALRASLAAEFADDVRTLGRIIGRDLSAWAPSMPDAGNSPA